uniref:Uncharacterized protein n=2 Tax=Avena sativa TaxID=4498 RepID=A0ACD5Z2W3_AVESA
MKVSYPPVRAARRRIFQNRDLNSSPRPPSSPSPISDPHQAYEMASTFRAAARVASAACRSAASRSIPSVGRSAARRAPCISRLPVELGCIAGMSLLPLHSAVAAARLTSRLSTASRSSCALSQGT